ncbi:hypothetical protein F511_38944 [Dorcoceras hygrometricum]|uniref:Uncharacterized protein n=1 Tax=Dorcoceras hygrometricum TaxID=472368 RepID=A0A2Z7BMM8_9LAMI|nr:hypothetical protein F511_38944 [Dorcoceras hygrometricum]
MQEQFKSSSETKRRKDLVKCGTVQKQIKCSVQVWCSSAEPSYFNERIDELEENDDRLPLKCRFSREIGRSQAPRRQQVACDWIHLPVRRRSISFVWIIHLLVLLYHPAYCDDVIIVDPSAEATAGFHCSFLLIADVTADFIFPLALQLIFSHQLIFLHLLIMISSPMTSSSMVHLDVPAGSLLMFQLVHIFFSACSWFLSFQLIHYAPAGSTWPPPDYE